MTCSCTVTLSNSNRLESSETIIVCSEYLMAVAYRGGDRVGELKSPQIPNALQNRAKLNPIVKTVKNC